MATRPEKILRAGSIFEVRQKHDFPWYSLAWFDWMDMSDETLDAIYKHGKALKDVARETDRSLALIRLLTQVPGSGDTTVLLDGEALHQIEKSWAYGIAIAPTMRMILGLWRASHPLEARVIFWTV